MNTRKSAVVIASLLLAASPVMADNTYDEYYDDSYESSEYDAYTDKARVLKVRKIYETVRVNNPETRCWHERVHHRDRGYREKSYTPTIAGAILGGVIGNQFGSGRGRDAMTVAGTVLGGSIGNDYANDNARGYGRRYTTTEKRCETIDHYEEHQEVVGYKVKYRYKGNDYWTRTSTYPGDYIDVRVSVEPVHF